ncbi:hypothetical protein BSAF29S_02733 [Bacillus safensis subsp. safensis]
MPSAAGRVLTAIGCRAVGLSAVGCRPHASRPLASAVACRPYVDGRRARADGCRPRAGGTVPPGRWPLPSPLGRMLTAAAPALTTTDLVPSAAGLVLTAAVPTARPSAPCRRPACSGQWPGLGQLVVDGEHLGDRLVLGRPGCRLAYASPHERLPVLRVREEDDGVGECPGVALGHEFRGVADEFGEGAHPGGDERHARVQRLLGERRPRVLAAAGQHRHVGRGEQVGGVLPPTEQPHRQVPRLDGAPQFAVERPLPRDDHQRCRVEALPGVRGVHQHVMASVPLQGADGDDQRAVHGAEFGAHLGPAPLRLLRRRRAARAGRGPAASRASARCGAPGPPRAEVVPSTTVAARTTRRSSTRRKCARGPRRTPGST